MFYFLCHPSTGSELACARPIPNFMVTPVGGGGKAGNGGGRPKARATTGSYNPGTEPLHFRSHRWCGLWHPSSLAEVCSALPALWYCFVSRHLAQDHFSGAVLSVGSKEKVEGQCLPGTGELQLESWGLSLRVLIGWGRGPLSTLLPRLCRGCGCDSDIL